MDLSKILGSVENKDDIIKQIEAAVGKEFVPRTEFNAKNDELKAMEKQLGEATTNLDKISKEKADFEKQVAELTGKVGGYEKAALKSKIAHETGLPYELANRLTGDDEKALRADAESLAALVKKSTPTAPLKSTETKKPTDNAMLQVVQELTKGE